MESSTMADVSLSDNMNDAAMGDSMDDLFGDTTDGLDLGDVNVSLPVVSIPPPPGLVRRIAQMQTSGACTRLAWSNTGSIARISEDGSTVTFRILARDLKTKSWSLSPESKYKISASADCHFVHLQFNHLGQDLALVDNLGRVQVYGTYGGNGKMQLVTADSASGRLSELDAVVGLHWLPQYPQDCRQIYIGPASRSINGWTSQSRTREANAIKVHHPADNARALLYVSRSGKLTLRYAQEGWKSTTISIHTAAPTGSLLTHADLCEHHGGLLLVTFDTARQLQLHSVSLEWHATYTTIPNHTQQVSSVAPELKVTALMTVPDPLPQHIDNAKLVQLSLVPTTAEVVDQHSSTSTTVLATFTRASIPEHAVSQFQESSTMLLRWQVESETPTLHGGFRHLKPNAQLSSTTATKTLLRRQPDLASSKLILSIHTKCFDTILACIASDGSVEFRDRATFELLESYMDTDHVYSLPQSGFSYLSGEHNIDAAISYDGSAMVALRSDGKLETSTMSFQYGWQRIDDSADSGSLAEAAIVCLARQYMTMVCCSLAPDEVLSLLPTTLPEDLQHLLTREVFRLTRHSPDISGFEEKVRQRYVITESLLPRAFSLQLCLGTQQGGRSLTGQYAWVVLNLRHICLCISQIAMTRIDPTQGPPVDHISSVHGLVNWGIDIIIYILNAVLSVKDITSRDLSKPARGIFENYMVENNNPAFLLLLCSYPRTLLKLLSQILPRMIKLSQSVRDKARSLQERQILTQVGMLEKSIPFTFEAFKTFLDHTEATMQTRPTATTMKPGQPPPSPDLSMTITGKLADELEQPLRALLISAIPTLLQDADWSKIYFHDFSWLGLGGKQSRKLAESFDVLKKTPLPKNANLRRCRRCGSVMEDITIDRPREVPSWYLVSQRYCVCMCTWFVP